MRTIAIDSDLPALQQLGQLCKETGKIRLEGTFSDPRAADEFLGQNEIDLIFVGVNGSVADSLNFCRKHSPGKLVVFTSLYPDHAVEAFNLRAVDYLLKPFSSERFISAVDRAWQFRQVLLPAANQIDYLVVREKYSLRRIYFESIVYIEALDDYVKFFFTEGEPLVIRMTMKSLLEKLPATKFVRVHRSYIIAVREITRVKSKEVFLGECRIPIGERYEAEFLSNFKAE